ncbi:hypothetical protein COO60DRAFT_1703503 [Scenedesmus sp. NREL 46B-D3]|nr:hypothetical protein COO60DRAFT_1703503 [Scenedesmus sp. NREL 46B-D3]
MDPASHALDLDRLFHEGDDQTWEMEDWNWDPYNILAEPKEGSSPVRRTCQSLKRHKADHRPTQQQQQLSAAGCGSAAAPGQQLGGCHAGMTLPQQLSRRDACGMPQPQQQQMGMFQGLLANDFSSSAWSQQLQQPTTMTPMQQQQQQQMQQQQQQQQAIEAQLVPGMQPAGAAFGAGGACCGSNAAAAAAAWSQPCQQGLPGAGRQCQALAGGLPFQTPANMTLLQQQQQQQAGMCANPGTAAPAPAAGFLGGAGSLHHAMSTSHMELGTMLQQQQQQAGVVAGLARAQSQPAPASAAAAASSGGVDSSSAAESASDGLASAHQQQQLHQGAAAPQPVMMHAGPNAAAEAAAMGSPSTLTSAGQQLQQHMAQAGLQATPGAGAAMTGESDAAAAGAAAAAAAAAGVPVLPGADEGGEQKLVCQVPGCGRDLQGLKEYHQRYRICDVHIKLPQVMKDGRLQRFCQQCGRFHDLSAFDGNRKSCREQLQKHNARRRRRAALEQNMSLADSLLTAVDDKGEVGKLLQGLLSNPFQLQALRGDQPGSQPSIFHSWQQQASCLLTLRLANAPTYEIARDIMDGSGAFAPSFASEHRVLRLSAKLFNVTPGDLPPDVRGALTGWLGSAPAAVEGYMRPGCVLLNLHITLDSRSYEEAAAFGMQRLLVGLLSEASHAFWRSQVYLLQLLDTVAVVARGSLLSLEVMGPQALAAHKLPNAVSVSPLAVVAGEAAELALSGRHISSADASLVVKGGGRLLHLGGAGPRRSGCSGGCCGSKPVSAASAAGEAAAAAGAAGGCRGHAQEEVVGCSLAVPAGVCGQVLWVEVARGAFLSQARPVLVVDDPLLAQEVCALQALEGSVLSSSQVDALLLDLGLVLRHISSSSGRSTVPAAAGIGHAAIAEKARRLIAFACDQGWVAVASAVLPLASACGTCAYDIVAAIHDSTAQDGLSLLHRAVRSGSPRLVRGLLDWGAAHAYAWRISRGGPAGISPLHLAALLDDDTSVALMLLDACEGASAFTDAKAADGVTPFQLAFQMGHYSLDRVLAGLGAVGPGLHRVLEQQLQPSGWQLLKMAAEAADDIGLEAAASAAAACAGGCAAGCAGSSQECRSPAAAAAAAMAAPLKERVTSYLDACLYCQSTLPPLLLTIKASCAGCGERQPCVKGAVEQPATPPVAAPAAAAWARRGSQPASAAAAAVAAADVASLAGGGAGGPDCVHATGRVLSVTALCQTCHANRVLEVA